MAIQGKTVLANLSSTTAVVTYSAVDKLVTYYTLTNTSSDDNITVDIKLGKTGESAENAKVLQRITVPPNSSFYSDVGFRCAIDSTNINLFVVRNGTTGADTEIDVSVTYYTKG